MKGDLPKYWLQYFEQKEGCGAVICEGKEISAACDEMRRLRATEKRLNELVKAVEWEREARRVEREARGASNPGYGALAWADENLSKSRAAVDALIKPTIPA
jgi:hypothetical protein